MNKKLALVVGVVGVVAFGFFIQQQFNSSNSTPQQKEHIVVKDTISEPTVEYGIETDSFAVYKDVIKPNEFLANILLKYNIPYTQIDQLAKKSKEIFDVRKIAAGKNYTILCSKDSTGEAQCFIYEPNAIDYVVFDMRDTLTIYKGEREVKTKIKTAEGVINSSLY